MNKMESHFELTDNEFEEQFQACTLSPAIFSHEAHLRLAWIHITKYGIDRAVTNITEQLLKFVDYVGAAGKYNKTVTVAAIKAVNHFIGRSNADSFHDFIRKNSRLKFNFKELMSAHYQTDIFKSDIARQQYLEPDLLPFT